MGIQFHTASVEVIKNLRSEITNSSIGFDT